MALEDELKTTCRFCKPPDQHRILLDSDNFYVMVSLGAIVEGYLLLISKSHIESCAQIPDKLRPEFFALIDRIKSILNKEYGCCVFFEHGRSASCLKIPDEQGSKHCYHAHLHCVPVSFSLNKQIDEYPMNFMVRTLEQFFGLYESIKLPYLFVWDAERKIYFIETEIQRQYLRFLVAKGIGQGYLWDWIKFPQHETIDATIRKLKHLFD